MFTWTGQFLAAPVFEDDEDKTRAAHILNAILRAVLVVMVVASPVDAAASIATGQLPTSLLTGAIGTVVVLGLLILTRRGHIQLASVVLAFALVGIVTLSLCNSGGIHNPTVGGYVVVVVVTGLLLGGRAAIAFALLSVLAMLGMFYAETRGLVVPAPISAEIPQLLITYAAILGMTALLLHLAVRSINDALERARRNERAQIEANRELQAIRASLEQRVAAEQATVQEYVDHMAEVAGGNLAARLALGSSTSPSTGSGQGPGLRGDGREVEDDPLIVLGHNLNEMTASLQGMIDRERSQREIIEAQQQAILELSTPVIPVMDRIIVMPLIGTIDTGRAKDITRSLLAGVREHRAKVVILDITGVPIVDSGVASHLNKTIQVARLKGARTIVTGISDAVAETIVDLGIDWSGIETLGDLQTGLVVALNSLGIGLTRRQDDNRQSELRATFYASRFISEEV